MPVLFALLLALLTAAGLAVAGATPAFADTTLCTSSTSNWVCTGGGTTYPDHGYGANNANSYWSEFTGHNCTNYVAYVEVQDNGFSSQNAYNPGNANLWEGYFTSRGFAYDSHPAAGSVAWWDSNYHGADSSGHVAYVESVNSDGSITISEDNWGGVFDWRVISAGSQFWPSGFIHLNDLPNLMFLHKLSDGASANMYVRNLPAFAAPSSPVRSFQSSLGWNWNNMKVGRGDVNGDGISDLVMLHETSDGGANLYVFDGGAFSDTNPVIQFAASSGWSWANMDLLVGDFNGDGKADVAIVTKTGDGGANLYIYNATGFSSPGLTQQFPGTSGWSWSQMKFAVGDVNGDGISDILMLHQTSDGGANLYTLVGGTNHFAAGNPVANFAGSSWSWANMDLLAGKFDGSSKAGAAILTKTGDGGANLYIYNAPGFSSPGLTQQFPGSSGWSWSAMKVGSTSDLGDGDGVADIMMLHQTSDGGANLYTLLGGTNGFAAGSPVANFPGSSGWSWASMLVPGFVG